MSRELHDTLLKTLETRFEKNLKRHRGVEWAKVAARLGKSAAKLWSLNEMERTGGEPDVVGYDKKTDEYLFYDCSQESPKGRRSLCYDREAWKSRKENKPEGGSAMDMAMEMVFDTIRRDEEGTEIVGYKFRPAREGCAR